MSQQVTYDYASGDLLRNPNTYFYSPYYGTAFLEAWSAQRNSFISEVSDEAVAAEVALLTATDELLADIREDIEAKGANSNRLSELKRILQRFEVTKRLHATYDENWRPVVGSDFLGLERYVRFGEAVEMAYSVTGFLPFLNAMLKCLDTLTALSRSLTAGQKLRVASLIVQERAFVQELARSIGAARDT